jgi:hypothetical protein
MRKLIVPFAILAMAALLVGAVAVDSVRLALAAHYRAEMADWEMAKNEMRLVTLLESSAKATPEVQSAIANLKSIHGRAARMDRYDALVAAFRKTMAGAVDPTNPLDRKFMDDAAGTMNRREVAQKEFDVERAAYNAYVNSWRGRLAQKLSTPIRRDADKWTN